MILVVKQNKGISLLLSLGFSITLLVSASMITTAINSAQKNIRNIEDVNIAFFAAEAGIEEAMYYKSWHRQGFQAKNDNNTNGWQNLDMTPNIPNLFYQWNIESRIKKKICEDTDPLIANKCKGILPFGKSLTLNFSYDDNTKTTSDDTNYEHSYLHLLGTSIKFYYNSPPNADTEPGYIKETDLKGDDFTTTIDETYLASMSWLGSYINIDPDNNPATNDQTTEKLLPLHNQKNEDDGAFNYGKESGDCYQDTANNKGKFICRERLRIADNDTDAVPFDISNSFKGIDPMYCSKNNLASNCTSGFNETSANVKNLEVFYDTNNTNITWRKLKFFYINIVPGAADDKPSLDKINYKITLPSDYSEMVAPNTIITSTGRSGDIISNLTITIDNTQESQAFDYGALLD